VGNRRLTLLRHGHAQAQDATTEDFERTLTRRGNAEAEEMGKRLVARGLVPDLIVVSPAERAWATAQVVAEICELDPKFIQCARELYLASPETLWRIAQRTPLSCDHVLLCGHNPSLSQVASRLGPRPQKRELPTAGIATALWTSTRWESLQPESAGACELDDPESLADLWV